MFALVVRFNCRDAEAAQDFDRVVATTVEQIVAEEPGTLVYATHTVEDEPLSRVFYEVYRDREAFDRHNGQPYVQRFLEARESLLADYRVEFLGDGPAKGLPPAS